MLNVEIINTKNFYNKFKLFLLIWIKSSAFHNCGPGGFPPILPLASIVRYGYELSKNGGKQYQIKFGYAVVGRLTHKWTASFDKCSGRRCRRIRKPVRPWALGRNSPDNFPDGPIYCCKAPSATSTCRPCAERMARRTNGSV